MDPYRARKVAKVIAFVIIITMVITSFSFVLFLGSADSYVYAAETSPGLTAGTAQGENTEAYLDRELVYLESLIKDIRENYKDSLTYEQLMQGAYKGLLSNLDPYSVYYVSKKEGESFVETATGEFYGIGISVENYNGQCRVVSPIPGTPAEKAGILSGDIVTKVDDVDITKMTLDESVNLMRGPEGTSVSIVVQRSGMELSFTMLRAKIKTTSVNYKMLANNIGYIQITSFEGDTDVEFRLAMAAMKTQGAKSLIIDVRNNPGGLIDTAAGVAEQLMAAGPIVHFTQQGKTVDTISAAGAGNTTLKTVLLVNQGSASASEILAGALQDSGRAKVVGVTTFGKGIAQQIVGLTNGDMMKLSVYYFVTPKNKTIDHVGITPDYVVADLSGQTAATLQAKVAEFAPMKQKVKYKAGETGLNVFGAQERLEFLGYNLDQTGTMDTATVNAIVKFQAASKLYPYGGLDLTTMATLDKAVSSYLQSAGGNGDVQLQKAIDLVQ